MGREDRHGRSGEYAELRKPGECPSLTIVVRYDNINGEGNGSNGWLMTRKTRPVSWIKAALKDFETFPEGARAICLAALTIAAEGGKADIAKPMHGMGTGAFEIVLPFRGDAYRLVYTVQIAEDIWVLHV